MVIKFIVLTTCTIEDNKHIFQLKNEEMSTWFKLLRKRMQKDILLQIIRIAPHFFNDIYLLRNFNLSRPPPFSCMLLHVSTSIS